MLGYLNTLSRPYLITTGFILVILVGIADYLTGAEISSAIFYLFPVSLVAWYAGRKAGIMLSVISAAVWFTADLAGRTHYYHPLVHLWNIFASFGLFWIVSFILSSLKISLEHEKVLARTDPLTGVANQRFFNELANREITRSHRFNRTFSVAYIDIDDFKNINDKFGHSEGDAVLRSLTTAMLNNIREIDIAARIGGDEFAILLPETNKESAQIMLMQLQNKLLDVMQKKGWDVTFSIGVVTFMSPPASIDEMIRKVDSLMYSVKYSGKNMIKYDVFGHLNVARGQYK